jgi:predicted phage terminase large subunit-like protein
MNIAVATPGQRTLPPGTLAPLTEDEQYEAWECERDLHTFIKGGWRYVEPKAFQTNWHIEATCDHLEACANGQITRLLINEPPRHMKSLGANVFFPAWIWAQDPDPEKTSRHRAGDTQYEGHGYGVLPGKWIGPGVKFMHLSYDSRLSTRDSVKCRRVIESPWYQRRWAHRFSMMPDQNTKTRFDNLSGGHRLATSETGLITGDGGDIITFDDPHNVRQAESDVVRDGTLRFWDEAMPTRLNDPKRGVFIVIMQRVHERDLSGHILAKELGWTHLCLPASYERKHPYPMKTTVIRKRTGQVWKDPRTEGEPLWKERFDEDTLSDWKIDLGAHAAAGQLQQRPTARAGGLFKRHWFEVVDAIPVNAQWHRVRAWDVAGTEETQNSDPDYTVGVRMCRDPATGTLYIDSVVRERLSPGGVERAIKMTASSDGYGTSVRLPQDPGAAGKFQAYTLATKLQGYTVRIEREENSKENRADPFASQCEIGNVKLLRGAWNEIFIDELCAFNKGAHDDQVDAATAAFRALVLTEQGPLQGKTSAR